MTKLRCQADSPRLVRAATWQRIVTQLGTGAAVMIGCVSPGKSLRPPPEGSLWVRSRPALNAAPVCWFLRQHLLKPEGDLSVLDPGDEVQAVERAAVADLSCQVTS